MAFSLLLKNITAADSAISVAKNALRILLPMPILRHLSAASKRRMTEKYGKLNI